MDRPRLVTYRNRPMNAAVASNPRMPTRTASKPRLYVLIFPPRMKHETGHMRIIARQHLFRCAQKTQPAVCEQSDTICDAVHRRNVVRNDHARCAEALAIAENQLIDCRNVA